MLRVLLLGDLTVEVDGRGVEVPRAWRARLVLGWLALHPGTHPRASVAARFWPDVVDATARASLRNALWSLRRAAGADLLAASRERVGLGPSVWVDAVAFADLARAGDLADAVALCRGDLLPGVDQEWVHDAREAHRRQLSQVLEALAGQAEAAGNRSRAVALSRRRAELDPLDEDAHAALIARLVAVGDTVAALVCFDRHRDALRRELGVAPSPVTRGLVSGWSGTGCPPSCSRSSRRRPVATRSSPRSWRATSPTPGPPARWPCSGPRCRPPPAR